MTTDSRWRVYPRLGRVSNLPTVATQTAAGITIAGARADALDVLTIGAGLMAAYVAGMFLNDAFDRSVDARDRPDRPIPAGHVDAREVFAAGAFLLAFAVTLLTVAGARHGHASLALLVAVALGAVIVLYDARHKGKPGAPLVMGACRGLVYLCAAAALAGALPALSVAAALAMASYVAGLSEVARAKRTPAWAAPALFAAPLALAVALVAHHRSPAAMAFALGLVAVIVHALRLARTGARERATVALLAGMSLIDAALLAAVGHPAFALLAVMALPVTRALQRVVRGT